MHADVPVTSALYVPAPQAVHTAEVLAATTLPYMPAEQLVQPEVPVASPLYVPASHAVQAADVLPAATLP